MSLAGPHGEAACKHCGTLQDLDHEGRFRYHNTHGGKSACVGSKRWPEATPKELETLAFSSEPLTRQCPDCGRRVQIQTVGLLRSGWRYIYHNTTPTGDGCSRSGMLVGYSKEDGVLAGSDLGSGIVGD